MASSREYVEFVCGQIAGCGELRYKKMFGEYMVYVNDKPLILICDNTPFVKMLPELFDLMASAERGYPYDGAREHYILDVEEREKCLAAVEILEPLVPIPKRKK